MDSGYSLAISLKAPAAWIWKFDVGPDAAVVFGFNQKNPVTAAVKEGLGITDIMEDIRSISLLGVLVTPVVVEIVFPISLRKHRLTMYSLETMRVADP